MTDISLCRPTRLLQWVRLYRLYLQAFPAAERKPFSVIVKMYRKGKTDIWCVEKDGMFLGFACTVNGENLILLDYLAMEKRSRGMGIGSAALIQLQKIYEGRGLFVEIESADDDAPNREERIRRRKFYVNCGMEPMQVQVNLFGVKMELLGCGCRLDFQQYREFYRDHYSPWAAQHITNAQHPDAGEKGPLGGKT